MKKSLYDDLKRYSIKQTAKLTGVNEKTLRYYDELRLLTPLYRNKENKYRYYTIKQFYQIENLQLAKSFGLSMKDYLSIQITRDEIEHARFDRPQKVYENLMESHRRQIEELQSQIVLMDEFRKNLHLFQSYLRTGKPYLTQREPVCLLVVPAADAFESTSQKARALTHDPRYCDAVTLHWGVLLDTDAMKKGVHKIVYQYCQLNHLIEDENTILLDGGDFDTIIGRAWINGEHGPVTDYLTTHPCSSPYLIAEELGVFDEVDSIYHQIFIQRPKTDESC